MGGWTAILDEIRDGSNSIVLASPLAWWWLSRLREALREDWAYLIADATVREYRERIYP